ncbi:hypothetical protein GCM10023321_26600 [Pseudonocardia eucalypti]|uniref:DUF1700 domain-containing protein n=1 Tax=Pseudonocardia eucalypti TaxID=648755 RepID=A0ABP9PZK6_9PSEU|nr:hypothetical protein [Pseudonocardia eucalypti]
MSTTTPPAAPSGEAMIDEYLDLLGRRLRIDAGDVAGRDLLDESRDHLCSHREYLVDLGRPEREAAAAALADFGAPEDIVPRLRAELVRPHLRRLSAALLALGLVLGVGWTALFEFAPPVPWTQQSRPALSSLFDHGAERSAAAALLLATVSVALLVLPGHLRTLGRWRAVSQRWSARAAAASLLFGTAAGLQTFGYLIVRALISHQSLAWPAVITATLVTLAGAPIVARPLLAIAGRHLGRPVDAGRSPRARS